MFRPIDRERMMQIRASRRFDLWDYDAVVQRTTKILDWITGGPAHCMPPAYAGGPWPAEWIALFKRWVEKGCPRLDKGDGTDWRASFGEGSDGPIVALEYSVRKRRASDQAWLERLSPAENPRQYILYLEPGTTGDPVTAPGRLEFPATTGVTKVEVTDFSGTRTVDIKIT
jgi:hypothetical protein